MTSAVARNTAAKEAISDEPSETASAPAVHMTLPTVMIAIAMSLRTRSWKAALAAVKALVKIVTAISTPAKRADGVGMMRSTAAIARIVVGIASRTRREMSVPSHSPSRSGSRAARPTATCVSPSSPKFAAICVIAKIVDHSPKPLLPSARTTIEVTTTPSARLPIRPTICTPMSNDARRAPTRIGAPAGALGWVGSPTAISAAR